MNYLGYIRYLPVSQNGNLRINLPLISIFLINFDDDYLDSFAKITSRNRDIDLVKSIIKPYFDGFDDPINAMCCRF